MQDVSKHNEIEKASLMPYAVKTCASLGRKHAESPHGYRPAFERDRERIIHCSSFRRLTYKTQVFVNHEGDHFRTRLTHTIAVSYTHLRAHET